MSFFSRFKRKSGKSQDDGIDAEHNVDVHKFLSLVNLMPKKGKQDSSTEGLEMNVIGRGFRYCFAVIVFIVIVVIGTSVRKEMGLVAAVPGAVNYMVGFGLALLIWPQK